MNSLTPPDILSWCDQIHGESIRQRPALQDKAQKLLEIQCTVWQRIENLFQSTRCMVTFLSNSLV